MDEALKAANRQLKELRDEHNLLLKDYIAAVRGRCTECVHFVDETRCELPRAHECRWEFAGWKPHDEKRD